MSKRQLLLALVLLLVNPVWAKTRRTHRTPEECRITWQSLYTGKTSHGAWINSYIPWDVANKLNEKYPALWHEVECRPKVKEVAK